MDRVNAGHKIQVEILLLDPFLMSSGICAFIADVLNYCINPVTSMFYSCCYIYIKDSADTLQNASFCLSGVLCCLGISQV